MKPLDELRELYPDWKYWETVKGSTLDHELARADLLQNAIDSAKFYYTTAGNITGGHYHVILDDGNTDRTFVNACLHDAFESRDLLGVALGYTLLTLTDLEREILYDHYDEYSE